MDLPIITQEMADRINRVEIEAHLSRVTGMREMPGNPLAVETQYFGSTAAFIVRGAPYLDLSRVLGLGVDDEDRIDSILDWFHERSAVPHFDISPHSYSESLFRQMAKRGLYQNRFLSVLYCLPERGQPAPPAGITVREFPKEELDAFAALAAEIDGIPPADQPLWKEVIKAQFKDWRGYISYVGHRPAGHAVMYLHGGVATLMYAATKPEFRGYGSQTALLRQRIADASESQCDLVIGASYPGTVSQRNQMRARMRLAYTKAIWTALHR